VYRVVIALKRMLAILSHIFCALKIDSDPMLHHQGQQYVISVAYGDYRRSTRRTRRGYRRSWIPRGSRLAQ
jgi:hypothetical protein